MDEPLPLYPVFLSMRNRLAVVVGGGEAAERKARTLVASGADVLVISPEPTEGLEALEASCDITLERRGYVRGDLENAALVISTVGDQEVDRAVFAEAEDRNVLVNVGGATELSSFVMPSVVRRGLFQIAVSTAGAAPEVAKRVRRELRDRYGEAWGPFVTLLGQVRTLLTGSVDDPAERKRLLEELAGSDLLERIEAGKTPSAEDVFARMLADRERAEAAK